MIDEYVIHNGKKRHIKNLYKKYNFKIPILCLIEDNPEANMNNSFINFFQKPLNKKTLSNALKPYLREASFSKINAIIKLGKFNFDSNYCTNIFADSRSFRHIRFSSRDRRRLYKNFQQSHSPLRDRYAGEQTNLQTRWRHVALWNRSNKFTKKTH